MNPRIELKGPLHFVGISDNFISVHSPDANNFTVIPALWARFGEVVEAISDPVDRLSYGVICDIADRSHPDELCYIAAVRVSSERTAPKGLVKYLAPESSFAIVEHRGPVGNIGQTLREFGEWLRESAFSRGVGAEIEVYPSCYDPCGVDSVMETWIPVVKN